MRKPLTLAMAASLSLASWGLVGCDRDETTSVPPPPRTVDTDARTAGERTGDALDRTADRTGDTLNRAADRTGDALDTAAQKTGAAVERTGEAAKQAADKMTPGDATAIYEQTAEITNAALTKGGFDDLVERLAKPDRDRLNEFANGKNFDDFDAKVDTLQAAWKAKYNQQFDLDNSQQIFGQQMKIANVQAPAEGNATATATLPAMKGGSEIRTSWIREAGAWKLDLNNSVTGPQLKTSLMKHLDEVMKAQSSWPTDVNEAYRTVAHHVLMALQDAGK